MPSFADQLGLTEIDPNTFISLVNPQRMGNGAPIAYGGCPASLVVHAACRTVKPTFHAYSVLGAFHGPTRIDRKVICRVTRTRDTKTFATRRVIALQTMDDGTERPCMEVMVDFQVEEPAMYEYSAPPSMPGILANDPFDPATTASSEEVLDRLVATGHISEAKAAAYRKMFGLGSDFFELRQCTLGVSGQNLNGLAKQLVTTQDHLPMTEKSSAEWQRAKDPLATEAQNMAALAFLMDGALSFLPLVNDHKMFEDAGACSTLDFALRVMRPAVDMHGWHLRERKTVAAAAGRTFGESRLWDQQGNLVAVETQACILRPLAAKVKANM
ncbi:hypothetical protein H2198_001160 [Neophaeococcomyces mojaviensis]|uniref:Uncharacterized protein n=1 Tax=Neophaeococcomyces mojaviensis TaxID=3383035 RepID=A0ACC3AI19_9EURO|nr:hypothetical protein H2198_001160 [Knufia sp. JES_112]